MKEYRIVYLTDAHPTELPNHSLVKNCLFFKSKLAILKRMSKFHTLVLKLKRKSHDVCKAQVLGFNDDMTGVLVQCTFANNPVVSTDNKKPRQAGFRSLSCVT